jgi:hypothetical protein
VTDPKQTLRARARAGAEVVAVERMAARGRGLRCLRRTLRVWNGRYREIKAKKHSFEIYAEELEKEGSFTKDEIQVGRRTHAG